MMSVASAVTLLTGALLTESTQATIALLCGVLVDMPFTCSAYRNGSRLKMSRNAQCAGELGSLKLLVQMKQLGSCQCAICGLVPYSGHGLSVASVCNKA